MTDRELMQQALDALEKSRVFVTSREKIKHPEGTEWYDERIEALRAALAQQENQRARDSLPLMVEALEKLEQRQKALAQPEQEPIPVSMGGAVGANVRQTYSPDWKPQREWHGLTDDDFIGLTTQQIFAMKFAEAKLREKNT